MPFAAMWAASRPRCVVAVRAALTREARAPHRPRVLDRLATLVSAHATLAWGLSLSSAVCFVVSLVALPMLIARAPADYFVREGRASVPGSQLGRIVRNLLGVCLLVAGVLMLVLPGQGLLTILLAVTLLDVPGKWKLVRALAQRPQVVKALQWVRARAGKPPFESL